VRALDQPGPEKDINRWCQAAKTMSRLLISIKDCQTKHLSKGKLERRMPLARYFLWTGGVLLALLFALDACLPKLPAAGRTNPDLLVIRIHSDRKWPERVVYDTNLPTVTAAPVASTEILPAPAPTADVSAEARVREAFAKLQAASAEELQPSAPKEPATTQPKRKVAKKHAPALLRLVERPQFGFYGRRFW